MMSSERRELEEQVLRKYLPSTAYKFMDMYSSMPYIRLAVKTKNKKYYTLHIELQDFPNSIPKVFVTTMLKTRGGENMSSPSASMHTLSSEHGWTRICHYGTNAWNPYISIFKVYVRCKLWLEVYELHLQTGNTMDYYLAHAN